MPAESPSGTNTTGEGPFSSSHVPTNRRRGGGLYIDRSGTARPLCPLWRLAGATRPIDGTPVHVTGPQAVHFSHDSLKGGCGGGVKAPSWLKGWPGIAQGLVALLALGIAAIGGVHRLVAYLRGRRRSL